MFYYVYVCVFTYLCVSLVHINEEPTEARSVGALELGLQVVVSHKMWVLSIEHNPTGRTVHAFHLQTLSLTFSSVSLFKKIHMDWRDNSDIKG